MGVGLALALNAVLVTGCSGTPNGSRKNTATTESTPSSTSTSTTAGGAVPTLGLTGAWSAGTGFGMVRPTEVYLGGDPTGLISTVTWSSWGAQQATGTGTGSYLAANEITAHASSTQMTIVAFDLGTCDGHAAYKEVEWYAPSKGAEFDPSQAVYTCYEGYVNPGNPGFPS